ncbi:hypothetical protein [Aliiroseovarius sp. 2305UL8-7]|uniref:hypothetical protein n=1 Tax=Aliiroseovarius conchicola TaxID=3121637 RepID=UPI00352889AB
MRVTTPIADMDISIDRLRVEDGVLVMTNSDDDAMQTRTVMNPEDVRKIFGALMRPKVLWFAFTCLFRSNADGARPADVTESHPTPNPW